MLKHTSSSISPENLRKKLFLYLAAIQFVFALFMVLVIAYPIYDRLKETENNSVRYAAQLKALAVNEWSRRIIDLAGQVTSRTQIREELEKYNQNRVSPADLKAFADPRLADAMNFSEEIIGITRLNNRGKPVAQCGKPIPVIPDGIDYSHRFAISFSTPILQGDRQVLVVSTPILNASDTYLGADLVLVDLVQLKRIILGKSLVKNCCETILMYRSGNNVFNVFSDSNLTDETLPGKDADAERIVMATHLFESALRGQEGVDDSFPAFVGAYHYLNPRDWGLVIVKNKAELYRTLNEKLKMWCLAGALVYFVSLYVFWCLMKPLAGRLLLHSDELNERIWAQTYYLEEEVSQHKKTATALEKNIVQRKKIEKDLKTALEEANDSREESRALLKALQSILLFPEFESAAKNIFTSCAGLIGAQSGYVAMLSEDGQDNEAVYLETGGLSCTVDPVLPMPVRGMRQKAYQTGDVVWDNHFSDSEHAALLPEGHAPIDNILFAPILVEKIPIGLIGLGNKPGGFCDKDIKRVRSFSDLAAVALSYSQTQEDLKQSEEKFSKAFNNAPIIMTISSLEDGRYIEVNEKYVQLMGYSRQEAIGKTSVELGCISREDRHRLTDELAQNGYIRGIELKMAKVDGTVLYCLYSGEIIRIGEKQRLLSLTMDISERKIIEKRILQAQKMESIGSLAGGIAHDFNNILFPIMGMSELLLEDLPADSREHRNVREILKAGRRGADLVQQILTFSRQNKHRVIPIKIQRVLKEVLKLTRATIPANIEMTQDIQADCGAVQADSTQIHQVAMNLITNAFHAVELNEMPQIIVKLREIMLQGSELPAREAVAGKYVQLTISDNGHGIPSDIKEKIFEPYFTTKPHGKGTGLGLAVVYGIIKKHKGEITVHSKVDKGTTFNVYLPVIEEETAGKTKNQQSLPTGKEKILLVDDEETIAALQSEMLVRLGYHIVVSTDAQHALDIFKKDSEAVDLVITDMNMPHLTGVQLAEKIMDIRPDLPVIICTGFSEQINRKKAADIGVKGVLMKPVDRSDLAKMVRQALD